MAEDERDWTKPAAVTIPKEGYFELERGGMAYCPVGLRLSPKFMGRWRSGAPLVLAPDRDDPALGADPLRNNGFNHEEMDPFGYACPLGSHARRLNPRDTAHYLNRRRMIRRGATYGVDRGIAALIICANLLRQFDVAQNVWINDKAFHEPRLGKPPSPSSTTPPKRSPERAGYSPSAFRCQRRPLSRVSGLPGSTRHRTAHCRAPCTTR